jgi:hypothetical protein
MQVLHQHCQDQGKLNAESPPQQLNVLDDALCLRQNHEVGRVLYHILLHDVLCSLFMYKYTRAHTSDNKTSGH